MRNKKDIYAPDDTQRYWKQLEKIAEQEDRSVSYLVNQAVKEYVEKEAE